MADIQGVQWTPGNEEKIFKNSDLEQPLAITAKNCLYLYCFLMQRIDFLTRPNDFFLSAQAWLQVLQEHPKLNKWREKRKKLVEPTYSSFETARVFTLPVEQLGYVMRCFAGISA